MTPEPKSTPTDRFALIVGMLQAILERLDTIERDVDAIDRTMRPYGDGTREDRNRLRRRSA